MADDLDDELLRLAGDSGDEEAANSDSAASHSPDDSSSMARKGTAKPVRRGRKSRKDEDGELSDAESHNSLDSASMSESDAGDSEGSGPDVDDAGPIFPYDKLYYSSKDKEEIMAMPEIQREQILSDRAQQVDRHNQDLALRRLLASREREEARQAKKNKRKAGAADLEDGNRKSSRQKMTLGGRKVGETSAAIDAYKRQREQKGKRDELRRREPSVREKSRSKEDKLSDDDAEGESEVEWDDRERSPTPPKDDPPAELKDLQRARVGRSNFAQVCFYPGFDDAISGCYVRVNIGPNRDTGLNEYRICLIKKFTEGRPYGMEGANGRTFATNQYAVLAHGKSEREFPFVACSDSPFTEAEFHRYRQTMIVEDCKMATKSMLLDKVADINRLLNHKFTNEELNEKLRKQGSLDTKMLLFKRMELEKKIKLAQAAGDDDEVAQLQKEMASMSTPKPATSSAPKPRAEKASEHDRLLELNLRNQRLNYENVRRAQIEERKASRKAAAAVARGETTANPFLRVRTLAKTHHDANTTPKSEDTESRDGTPAIGSNTPSKTGTPNRSNTPSSSQTKSTKGGVATIRHRNRDDENIAALDLDLDIEI
ncbi:RNA polymerase II transcription elongation factor Rtf1p [Aspergillus taichungensis]|uniref:RNA polymerase II transcription elongation factor Rtf1p n=1 Tax=Aspergillus taichungensis TaxID=482145 RepID=A0A2J5HTR9_9EURO|nr:RNA polymerase II transcription elongation factor Rtf1p [Aspergillus taichungensis]